MKMLGEKKIPLLIIFYWWDLQQLYHASQKQRLAIHLHADKMPSAVNETELELAIVYLVLRAIHMIKIEAVDVNVKSTMIVVIDYRAFVSSAWIHALAFAAIRQCAKYPIMCRHVLARLD